MYCPLEIAAVEVLRPMQTDATSANNSQHCWVLLANNVRPFAWAQKFDRLQTIRNKCQQLIYSRFSIFCLHVSCFLKLFAQLSLIRHVADVFTRPTLLGFHANGCNIVALPFTGHRTIEMLGLVGPKVWPVSNCTQQVPTSTNIVVVPCKRTQQVTTLWPTTLGPFAWNHNNEAHANGHNIVGQQHPTLLGPTMLWLVASVCMEPQQCWYLLALVAYSLKPVKLLAQQVPTFLWFCDRWRVAQQCCTRLHGTPTMLASWKRLEHGVSSWVERIIWGNMRRLGKKSKNASKCTKRWSDHEVEQLIDLLEENSWLWDM